MGCVGVALTLLTAALLLGPAEQARAHETDQYATPAGREFADLGDELTSRFYDAIHSGVVELNQRIRRARQGESDPDRLEELHTPEAVAQAVNRQFPAAYTLIEGLERRIHSEAWKQRFPGRVVGYKEQWSSAARRGYLPLDPRWIFRVWHASTIKAFGVYLGTDKVGHLTDMGWNYYLNYRRALHEGRSEKEAIDRALHLGTEDLFYSESGVLGYLSAGAYSNADLAANYLGLLFYRNLTEPVRLKGERRPPMVVRDGPYWRLAPHVHRHGDFLSWFFSDHLDEALNPSLFESEILRSSVRDSMRDQGDSLLWRYRDAHGDRRPPQYFADKAEALKTYWGDDYGHQGDEEKLITIAEACYGGFDPDAERDDRNALGHTPLHSAVLVEDREAVRGWIERNAAVNAGIRSDARYSSEWGSTPLHLAARDGRVEIARLLLEAGADVHARNDRGLTPLHRAGEHPELAGLLLEAGADPNAVDDRGRTPLHDAAGVGSVETVRRLLAHGAAVGPRDRADHTPLHRAAEEGHPAVAVELIEAGADVGARGRLGLTPLHRAARQPGPDLTAVLVDAGADVSARDAFGYTPLHEAARAGRERAVAVLLERGAEPEAIDAYGTRPLHLACRYGRLDAAQHLLIGGATVDAANQAGRTPLHEAASVGSLPLVRRLVSRGATPEATDGAGSTPGDVAEQRGYPDVTRVLAEMLAARS